MNEYNTGVKITQEDLELVPAALKNLELVWIHKHVLDRNTFIFVDHARKLVVTYYPAGGSPNLDALHETYKVSNSVSVQTNYHVASFHPADAVIPLAKNTKSVLQNVFDPMLSLYMAEVIIGPMFVITQSEAVKSKLVSVQEFIIIIDTEDVVAGLDISQEFLKLGDMRKKGDEVRKLMQEIESKTGIHSHFAHED